MQPAVESVKPRFMLLRSLSVLTLACASLMPAGLALAQASGAAEPAGAGHSLQGWLFRINDAARYRSFQGTFVVSSGGAVASARIAHFCDGGNQFEHIESLDGQARHVFRQNDLVHTLWPAKRVALVERREQLISFPAIAQSGEDRVADFYEVFRQDVDRVAGYVANVLTIRPKDGHRFGFRLWAEQATGLLLRADVLGERNEVIETSAFSDLTIGVRPQLETVLQPMKKLDGYRIVRPVLTPTSLEAEGWVLKHGVPGFRQVSCVNRPIDGGPDADAQSTPQQVLQAIFSDGLTYVSVFIEPYDANRHGRPLLASVGATQTLMRRHGEWWLTVVGDVPASTLRLFAQGLERRK